MTLKLGQKDSVWNAHRNTHAPLDTGQTLDLFKERTQNMMQQIKQSNFTK